MRKQELVQLHALCSHVRRYADHRYEFPDGAFDRYDRMDVPPVAIYRKKEAHEEALDRLLEELTSALATHADESPESPPADELPESPPADEPLEEPPAGATRRVETTTDRRD